MARFEIVIDDDSREMEPSKPWSAAVVDADSPKPDVFAVGVGTTPKQAVRDMLLRWTDEDGANHA